MTKRKSNATDSNTARARARVRLLIGPALATLRTYRAMITKDIDRTIARLEGLERWVDGGALPADWTKLAAAMKDAFFFAPGDDRDNLEAHKEMERLNYSRVLYCEVVEQVMTETVSGLSIDLSDHATRLVRALEQSHPNEETPGDDVGELSCVLRRALDANGIADTSGAVQPTSRGNREFPPAQAEMVGHA